MSHMFENSAVKSVSFAGSNVPPIVPPISTHNLKDAGMEAMFKGCSALQSVNMGTCTAIRVTSMKDMFNGCRVLRTIHIENIDMSNVTNKENMCLDLNADATINPYSGECYQKCTIYCKGAVASALRESETGLGDLRKFTFTTTD